MIDANLVSVWRKKIFNVCIWLIVGKFYFPRAVNSVGKKQTGWSEGRLLCHVPAFHWLR